MKKEKTKILFTGETPVEIRAGEFQGSFKPDQEYKIDDPRFANYLLEQEENFELVPVHTYATLNALKKEKLVEIAEPLGVEDFDKLNKEPLIEAILAKQEETNNV